MDISLDTSVMESKAEETLEVTAWAYIRLARNGYVFIKPRLQDDVKVLTMPADNFLQRFTRRIEKTNVEILGMLSDLLVVGLDNINKVDFLSRPITSLKKEELHQSENLFRMLSVYCAAIWRLLPDSAGNTKQGFLNLFESH